MGLVNYSPDRPPRLYMTEYIAKRVPRYKVIQYPKMAEGFLISSRFGVTFVVSETLGTVDNGLTKLR